MFKIKNFENLSFSNLLLLYKVSLIDITEVKDFFTKNGYVISTIKETISFLYKMSMFENYDFYVLVQDTCEKALNMILNICDNLENTEFYDELVDIHSYIKKLDFVANSEIKDIFNKENFKEKINFYLTINSYKKDFVSKIIDINKMIDNKFALISNGNYKNYFITIFNKNSVLVVELWKDNSVDKKESFNFYEIRDCNDFLQKIFIYDYFDYDYLINTQEYIEKFKENFRKYLIKNNMYQIND